MKKFTRADFLKGGAGLLGASLAPSVPRAEGAPPAGWEGPGLLPDLPRGFSLSERDRRWNRVRDMMRREGFDALLTPAGDGEGEADTRYLTQRGGWVVFPREGPVVLVSDSGDRGRSAEGRWADEVRAAEDGEWSPAVIEALRGAKLERARVGVGRLQGVLRNLEGDVNFTTFDRVRQALPGASFASAADPLMRVKLRRSPEEIAVLERATAAGERGLEALRRAARPGRAHKDAWIEAFAAMTAATGETPSRLAIRAGDEANTSGGRPLLETLEAGQVMNQEIGARVLGYMAQVNHSFCLGPPVPADWASAARYCIDLFDELVDWIRPGKRFMDLCRLYAQRARARSPELEPRWVLVHTAGLGDSPRMGLMRKETPDLVIEPAMVFTIKPRILIKGARPTAQFGDPVLVTERGARRLGQRKLEPLTGLV
jgi:Xaa-Pro aminopeptidase